jgi:hypothetical protein
MATNAWSDATRTPDPADRVAVVAQAKRELLLSVHRAKLPREELEDCFAQATLELVVRARRSPFASDAHAANALEQKFASRITDRVRAISGRSPIATILRGAASLDAGGDDDSPMVVADPSVRVEQQVLARHELRALRELAAELTDDQRLVLACQVSLGMDCAQFCERYGWSAEKFRKVAQRARAKLRSLMDAHDQGERCRTLEPALLAVASRIADQDQTGRVQAHLQSCLGCAHTLRDLRAAERGVAAVLLAPGVVKLGLFAKAGAAFLAMRRLVPFGSGSPGVTSEAAGGGAVAGGSLLSAGAAKIGVTALCVAGAAGSYAVCSQVGGLPGARVKVRYDHQAQQHAPANVSAPARPPVAVPAGRRVAGRRALTPRPPLVARSPSRASGNHAEFGSARALGSARGRREFRGALAAAVVATFETTSSSSSASREFSPSNADAHSPAVTEFGS